MDMSGVSGRRSSFDWQRLLFAAACVGVVGLGWLFPTERMHEADGAQTALLAAGVLMLAVVVWLLPDVVRSVRPSPLELTLWLFVVVGSIATMVSPAPLGRLAQTVWWIQALVVVAILARMADRRLVMTFLHGYSLLAMIACAIYLVCGAGGPRATPLLILRNHLAFLLILPATFHLHRLLTREDGARPLVDGAALLLLVSVLLLTQSRAVWTGLLLAAVVIVIAALRRKLDVRRWGDVAIVVLIPVAILIAVIGGDALYVRMGHASTFAVLDTFSHLDEGSIGGRLRRWSNALALIQDHWLFGVGLGNWAVTFGNYRDTVVADSGGDVSAANTYLLVLAETGVVGLTLFLAFVWGAIRRGVRERLPGVPAAAIAWLVVLMFHSLYDYEIVLLGFAVVLGLLLWPAGDAAPVIAPQRRIRAGWTVALLVASVACAASARYGLASLERWAVYSTVWTGDHGANRLLWRVLSPVSPAIDVPLTRKRILANAPGMEAANRFQLPDKQDFDILLGDLSRTAGADGRAREFYDLALQRNPRNVMALAHACAVASAQGHGDAARDYCRRGLAANGAVPVLHQLLAGLDEASGATEVAIEELEQARTLLRASLDFNEWGDSSRGLVSRDYVQFTVVNDDLARLRAGGIDVPPERVLQEVLETPLLHKSIAVMGCHLYFSVNANARYNLWRYDLCRSGRPVELMTNDSRAPFRLRTGGSRLYFMADERGNDRFSLYALDTVHDGVVELDLPRGMLLEYSPSPDGRGLAVVVYNRGAFRLYAGDPREARYRQVLASKGPLSEPVWDPAGGGLLVTQANHRLLRIDPQSGATTELIRTNGEELGQIGVSPDGAQIAYSTRSGIKSSALHLLGRDAVTRDLARSERSVLADPLWRDAHTLVFREIENDEYLLRQMRLDDGATSAIGPAQGVVYDVVQGADPRTLLFVAATDTIPASAFRIAASDTREELLVRLDWIAPATVIPHRRSTLDAQKNVSAYRYPARDPLGAVVVWLHGGSSEFSPRWHTYAQYFAWAGFDFVALNYPERWPRGKDSREDQAQATAKLVGSLRREGFRHVYLLGVSTGTQIIQEYLARGLPQVDGIVEYSPVDNEHWQTPRKIPPLLDFSGVNDPLLDHRQRVADIERYRALGDSIGWVTYPNEGHDLRGRAAIEDRLQRTRAFLVGLTGGASDGLEAGVVEVPGLDEDAALTRRVGGAVVPAE